MDQNPKNHLKVGFFVFLGIALILFSITSLSGGKSFFTTTITLHAYFDNVQGLNEGSIVSLSGVTIGNVSEIKFLSEENKLDVTMQINKKFLDRITTSSTVEIRTQGALGDKYVFVLPGQRQDPPVTENAVIEVNKSPDFLGMISEKGNEAGKIFDIITETHKILKTINDGNRFEKMMLNFSESSENLKLTSQESQKLIAELRSQNSVKLKSSIDKLDNILTKVDRGEGTLGALINDPSLHEQLKGMLGGTSRKKFMNSIIRTSIEKDEKN
jgi:phospholipid/cholesterol/gamma-HCH transport system substrate-binding protein